MAEYEFLEKEICMGLDLGSKLYSKSRVNDTGYGFVNNCK